MEMYITLWKEIEEQVSVSLETTIKNDAYINQKHSKETLKQTLWRKYSF